MYSYGPPHMVKQKQDYQLEHTYSSYVKILDVALKTCQKQWMIGRSGEKGSGISVLAARHDDDDDYQVHPYFYSCVQYVRLVLLKGFVKCCFEGAASRICSVQPIAFLCGLHLFFLSVSLETTWFNHRIVRTKIWLGGILVLFYHLLIVKSNNNDSVVKRMVKVKYPSRSGGPNWLWTAPLFGISKMLMPSS